MEIVVDTHVLVWNTINPDKISRTASKTLEGARVIFVPVIVLLEAERVFRKLRLEDSFKVLLRVLSDQKKYSMYPLDKEVFGAYLLTDQSLEIHDRVIVATAKILNLPIVTRDERMSKVYQNVIW